MCLILIVEDNTTFRKSLRDFLSVRFPSVEIQEAADGWEAMATMGRALPDMVFMDIKLPGANGLEVTRQIKQIHQNVAVAVLTSYDLPEYREAAFRSGANFFFTKGSTTGDEIISAVSLVMTRTGNIHPVQS